MTTILETNLPDLLYRGKVRDTYAIDDKTLLMVATDRISAFDVVLPSGIPDKGVVLNQISGFWFDKTSHLIPNHMIQMATDRADLEIPTVSQGGRWSCGRRTASTSSASSGGS